MPVSQKYESLTQTVARIQAPSFSLANSAPSGTGNSMVMASIQPSILSCFTTAIRFSGRRRKIWPWIR